MISLSTTTRIAITAVTLSLLLFSLAAALAETMLKLGVPAPAPDDPAKRTELATLLAGMEAKYGSAVYCKDGDKDCRDEVQLKKVLESSRDYDELLEYWAGCDADGRLTDELLARNLGKQMEALSVIPTATAQLGSYKPRQCTNLLGAFVQPEIEAVAQPFQPECRHSLAGAR